MQTVWNVNVIILLLGQYIIGIISMTVSQCRMSIIKLRSYQRMSLSEQHITLRYKTRSGTEQQQIIIFHFVKAFLNLFSIWYENLYWIIWKIKKFVTLQENNINVIFGIFIILVLINSSEIIKLARKSKYYNICEIRQMSHKYKTCHSFEAKGNANSSSQCQSVGSRLERSKWTTRKNGTSQGSRIVPSDRQTDVFSNVCTRMCWIFGKNVKQKSS